MSPVTTPLLDRVRIPADLRNFSPEQLRQLADELRAETIDAVSVTGGHLGASLGVVELTVAIHAVFDTPHDRLLWDVGHQAYPHKILRRRRDERRHGVRGDEQRRCAAHKADRRPERQRHVYRAAGGGDERLPFAAD